MHLEAFAGENRCPLPLPPPQRADAPHYQGPSPPLIQSLNRVSKENDAL